MLNLEELKARLEKLPQRRAERHLAVTFGDYTRKIARSREKLEQALKDIGYVIEAYPNSEFKTKVLPLLQSSVKESKKLHQEIEDDPNKVNTRVAENRVVKLGEYASAARSKCESIWEQEITGSVTKWEKIADVVQKLGAKGGQEFKQAVYKLKLQEIPKSDNELDQVKTAQKALQKGIANLGLEGPFGKFLKGTAERGASPKDLLEDEIRKKMDEYKLWDSFRVLLDK